MNAHEFQWFPPKFEVFATVILFLDFDGVLHQFDRAHGVFARVPHFERVMRDFPRVDIVISSAWREDHSLKQLRSFFSQDIARKIIGVTPMLGFLDRPYVREIEINAWLADVERQHENWVAIDDADWFFSPGCRNLILVDTNIGFNESTERELRARLAGSNA